MTPWHTFLDICGQCLFARHWSVSNCRQPGCCCWHLPLWPGSQRTRQYEHWKVSGTVHFRFVLDLQWLIVLSKCRLLQCFMPIYIECFMLKLQRILFCDVCLRKFKCKALHVNYWLNWMVVHWLNGSKFRVLFGIQDGGRHHLEFRFTPYILPWVTSVSLDIPKF